MLVEIILCCFSLMTVGPTNSKGDTGKGPGDVAYSGVASVPEIEPYVHLQLQLEEIADKSHLYALQETDRNATVQRLLQDESVQSLIASCQTYNQRVNCDDSLYRSYDGTCNNLKHPLWGSSLYKQNRLLPEHYDGQYDLRKSVDEGEDLPGPRHISRQLKQSSPKASAVSALFTFWGQFVAHDISLSLAITKDKSVPDCCGTPDRDDTQYCSPIEVEADDPFFSRFDKTCFNFARSAIYPTCTFARRSPLNKKTSFLDLSTIYGDNDEEASSVREKDGLGKLKSKDSNMGELMPTTTEEKGFCLKNKPKLCFDGADERTNQHTMLTIMHTLYVRMHNLIVDHLKAINPHWDGEKLFQEARRINIAIYQYTVYREYLPLLIGQEHVHDFDLELEESEYDDSVDPSESVEFSTAALRLHSMIPSRINDRTTPYEMRDSFAHTGPIFQGKGPALVAGSCEVPSLRNDLNVVEDMTNLMYKPHAADFGQDIASFNIQRGRDHGLPPYTHLVRLCSGEVIEDFNDLKKFMDPKNVEFLHQIYRDVQDVDLWIGLINEEPLEGGVVGPTAACIIGLQFQKLKNGDSFFVTHHNSRHPFTDGQIKFIESFNFVQLLCKTSNLTEVRVNPLMAPSEKNGLAYCETLPPVDWTQWKDINK